MDFTTVAAVSAVCLKADNGATSVAYLECMDFPSCTGKVSPGIYFLMVS